MITDSGKSMLVVGALILIPFLSLIVGRLRSLAIDFVGSAFSLTFAFFDAVARIMDDLTSKPELRSHAGSVVYVLVYVVMVMIVGGAACIWLQAVYTKDCARLSKQTFLERCGAELIYWIAVSLSIMLVLFAFSLNIGCRDIFYANDASTETLFVFFRGVANQYRNMNVVIWSTAVVLLFCVLFKYLLPPTGRTEG